MVPYPKHNMKNKDKISVIVPIYNMEKYLGECLESLVNQTYDNIEIVLVDDGSTDSSLEICNRYASKYNNIMVRHKENGGGGSARNFALDIVTGNYVAFVDSDDWVLPETFERMIELASKYDADITRCEVFKDPEKWKNATTSKVTVLDRESILENMLNDRLRSGALKMIKRSIIGDSRFPTNSSIDDMVFFSNIIERLNKMVYTDAEYYYYRYDRVDSMSNSKKRFVRNVYERFVEYTKRYQMAQRLGINGEEVFSKAIEHGLVFYDHFEVADQWKEERDNVLEYIRTNKSRALDSKYITNKHKIKIHIMSLSKFVYKMLALITQQLNK